MKLVEFGSVLKYACNVESDEAAMYAKCDKILLIELSTQMARLMAIFVWIIPSTKGFYYYTHCQHCCTAFKANTQ